MARRYGRLNKYDSRLRRCAISGLRFYESEMVHTRGMYIHPRFLDTDGVPVTKRIGAIEWLNASVPVEDETGATWGPTVHGLSLANYSAFFAASGVSLAAYAGTEGSNTPYMLKLYDSALKSATGYIGAADEAEALGGELITNGGFETPGGGGADVWDGWEEFVYDGIFTNETTIVKSGSDAMKNYWDGVTGVRSQLRQIISVTAGKLYKVSFWTRGDGTKDGRWDIYDTTNSVYIIAINNTGVTGTTYTEIARYITAPSGCSQIQIDFYSPVGGTFYVDDVSIKEVTHVGVTGIHIVSAMHGSTRNWQTIESGFNYNDSAYTFDVYHSEAYRRGT